ncbi:MAG: hypothetical protein ACRD1G_12320 [Acidimicrobiales bacterium]
MTSSRRGGQGNHRRRAPRAGEVVSAAARSGCRHWKRVLPAAVVVFGISALAETAIETWASHAGAAVKVPVGVLALGADLLGAVFFAGLLERLVGEAGHDAPNQSTLTVLRTLPYGRLILADLLIVLFVVLGTLALVVPGLVIFTQHALAGPIVNIEGGSAVSALRRSARLVRSRFWLVVVLVAIPLWVAGAIGDAVKDAAHGLPSAAAFVVSFVALVVLAPGPGLVQVELAYRLIEIEAEEPRR